MFDWYFKNYFIEDKTLFWVCVAILLIIVLLTIYLVYKELRGRHANK